MIRTEEATVHLCIVLNDTSLQSTTRGNILLHSKSVRKKGKAPWSAVTGATKKELSQEDSGISCSPRFHETTKAGDLRRHYRSERARGTPGYFPRLPPSEGRGLVQTICINAERRRHGLVQGLTGQLYRFTSHFTARQKRPKTMAALNAVVQDKKESLREYV